MSSQSYYDSVVIAAESKLAGQAGFSLELMAASIAGEWFTEDRRVEDASKLAFFELVELGEDVIFDAMRYLDKSF